MAFMNKMPAPVKGSPGGPATTGGNMRPPPATTGGNMAPVKGSPGGPSQPPAQRPMPPPATTGGNMRPPGGPSMPPPPMRPPGGPANTGVVPPSPGLMKTMKKGGKVAPAKAKTSCYKSGGSVKSSASSRGDGCATKGHTKGRIY